jgi:CRP-like cAMP-binding protein
MHDYLFFAANLLWVVCYGVRDVLILRCLAVVAMLMVVPFHLLAHDDPSWAPLAWNGLFVAINLVWIVMIILERRPPRLSPDEQKLYEQTFHGCSPREMLQLLSIAEWKELPGGTTLIERGRHSDHLVVIHSGTAIAQLRGHELAELSDGNFAGEISFLTHDINLAEIVTRTVTRIVSWPREKLEKLIQRRPDLRSTLHAAIGDNLIHKLSAAEDKIPELTVARMGTTNQPSPRS